jgi:hypothetical protein
MPPLIRDFLTQTTMHNHCDEGTRREKRHRQARVKKKDDDADDWTEATFDTPTETSSLLDAPPIIANPMDTDMDMDMDTEEQVETTTNSGWHLLRWWYFVVTVPLCLSAWAMTHRILAVLAAILVMPTLAFLIFLMSFLQGFMIVLKYRLRYGTCPFPKAPSHGIVQVTQKLIQPSGPTSTEDTKATTFSSPTPVVMDVDVDVDVDVDDPGESSSSLSTTTTTKIRTPLRLLVIGDSLAIGVGQSSSATPIMPETIAKSLSKSMGGRPVLWTCHGAPGASAGWIVRELERSIQQGQFMSSTKNAAPQTCNNYLDLDLDLDQQLEQEQKQKERHTNNNETDSTTSSSDESSSSERKDEETQTWQERLRQERIQFDPNTIGPFDIAVVLTGSNDLKSTFFPFILKGEDAEFRRQAQERGGGYGRELTRILQVLNRRMRLRLQTLRDSVEAATEQLRERLGSVDLHNNIHNHSSSSPPHHNHAHHHHHRTRRNAHAHCSEEVWIQEALEESFQSTPHNSLFPMVVLPGMPARSLPIFQMAPLRWLAVPIVEIMDSHKRNLAKRHPGEVLFVNAPSVQDIAEYSLHTGDYWKQQQEDQVLLNLKDIKRRHARRIEGDMNQYFLKQKAMEPDPALLPFRKRHHSMFSVDSIHPNDEGYAFWGRYIANSIVQEWKRKQPTQTGDRIELV